MKLRVEDLRAELGSRDNKLRIVREEMASVINLAKQKQSAPSEASGSDQASLPAAESSAAESSPAVQVWILVPRNPVLQLSIDVLPLQCIL